MWPWRCMKLKMLSLEWTIPTMFPLTWDSVSLTYFYTRDIYFLWKIGGLYIYLYIYIYIAVCITIYIYIYMCIAVCITIILCHCSMSLLHTLYRYILFSCSDSGILLSSSSFAVHLLLFIFCRSSFVVHLLCSSFAVHLLLFVLCLLSLYI